MSIFIVRSGLENHGFGIGSTSRLTSGGVLWATTWAIKIAKQWSMLVSALNRQLALWLTNILLLIDGVKHFNVTLFRRQTNYTADFTKKILKPAMFYANLFIAINFINV
ncbi:MAG: hypothetical protein RLZZ352_961 [Pseudomonadota bacterium]